ncbi:HAD family hydrolase [Tateyamaria sp. SN6-1]|uniref:HAD family hydrolase n=1 Tax=Tateyamaria sp. SN6-1 TaxID=3092148 RepID=UPI0039F4E595
MTVYSTHPAAYLFDMDGLLLDTERCFLEVGLPLLTGLGHSEEAMRAFFLSLIGSSAAMTHARLVELIGDEAHARQFQAAWRDALKVRLAAHVPLRPFARETLDQLAGQGARMAVVTSTHRTAARHHLHLAGLLEYFEVVVAGDEVTANKPDPAPYLQAAAMLGVAATDCAAFEDSDRGIASAVRAGCRAVQIPDLRDPSIPLPDLGQHVAADLRAAVALVRPN